MGMMSERQAEKSNIAQRVRARDLAALLVANAALAVGPWFVRQAEVGPVASAFWRLTLALPVLVVLAVTLEGVRTVSRRQGAWLALAGLVFAVDLAAWHSGILQTKLANATLLGNASSFLFPLYGFLILRRGPSRMQGLALVLAVVGAGLLMGRSYELSSAHLMGDLLCLFAGTAYTVYLVGIERARGGLPQWHVLTLSTAASCLPLLALSWQLGETLWPQDWRPLIVLALCSQLIGQGLLVLSLGRLPPLLIGVAFLIQPFIAALLGWFSFGERLAPADWIGGVLVGLALVLMRQPDRAKP